MSRQNNFDIIRLLLAAVVVFFHVGYISGAPAFEAFPRYFSGHLAVEGFFAISGFLIFASYERSSSLHDYFIKRAARILPGYWLATVFCLFVAFFYGSFHVARFLFANLTFANFLAGSIPGVFASNPFDGMNGALWTIKIEVMFYILVPVIVWLCRRLNRDAVLWTLFVLSIVYRVAMADHNTFALQLPGQLSFFMIGALIHYHLRWFETYGKWLTVAAALLYIGHLATGWFALRPAGVATLTLSASLLFPTVKGPTRWGDFSYGIYVLHWPIIQLFVTTGLYHTRPWVALVLTLITIAIAAVLSWFFVEKPSLALAHSRRIKNRYPAVTPS
ncbi:acyltransferase family protein [Edaphobacter modestus]|uniref:Peptidoglycan/LPS O-acetylase OafA/YrhL n=1 Tax=Edaphobacter modestus TaxID=388466 RepID=A0A4Q7Z0T8_9BACT|nr:acyltransferase [Edaphobacter modestus]RZU43221.1 peptidoglycan/LPS O-acetylase OafA/YrhL [Edaphobacter modestus]